MAEEAQEEIQDQTGEEIEGQEESFDKDTEGSESAAEGKEKEGGESRQKEGSTKEGDIEGHHDDPKFKEAIESQEKLTGILEKHGLDSVEDLIAKLDQGSSFLDLFDGDRKAAEAAVAAQKELNEYRAYWAELEEQERRKGESPDETIQRLEKEKKELEERNRQRDLTLKEQQEQDRLLSEFTKTVNRAVKDEFKDLPENSQSMIDLITGLKNPLLDVELEDKRAVKKALTDVFSTFKAFQDAIIQDYLKGKKVVEETQTGGGGGGGGEAPASGAKKVKDLKDARRKLHSLFSKG